MSCHADMANAGNYFEDTIWASLHQRQPEDCHCCYLTFQQQRSKESPQMTLLVGEGSWCHTGSIRFLLLYF